MCSGGQTERHCGKVRGRSNELAPDTDSPGVYTAGQGHGRCYRMRILDQISALVAVAFSVLRSAYHISENTWIIETIAYESPSTGLSYASNIVA